MSRSVDTTVITAPDLGDGVVHLRPWPTIDAHELRDAVQESLETVGRWQPWCHHGYGLEQASAWIDHCRDGWQSGANFSLAVCDASSGELAGGIGLNHLNRLHRSANLGYWMRQSRQSQGLTTRASVLMARFGFESLGLIRIEIVAEPDNLPSLRVAEKLGAHFEVVARHRLWVRDQPRDAAVYALIPADLRWQTA